MRRPSEKVEGVALLAKEHGSVAPEWFTRVLGAEVSEATTTVVGCRIAFRHWGHPSSPKVVLVHGSSANARWWDHIAPFLANAGYSVTALDLSGHGDSAWRLRYSWELWATEVNAIVGQSVGTGPPYVIAHSMGGRVALLAAVRSAVPWAGLVVIDTGIPVRPEPSQLSAPRLPSTERRTYPSRAEAVANFRLKDVPNDIGLPYIIRHVANASLERVEGGYAWKRDARTAVRHDQRPGPETLAMVRCPLVWVCAEYGKATPALLDGYTRLLGRPVTIVDVPGAYHHVMIDQPLALVTGLAAVLAMWETGKHHERRIRE